MSQEAVSPIPEPSIPPGARVGRAYIDAISDFIQNVFGMAIIAYAWLEKGVLDDYVALGALAVILGFVSVAQVVDRFTSGRAPRAPLTALIGLMGAGKAAAVGTTAAEVVRRITMLTLLAILPLVVACATLRTLNDHAVEFCESVMGAQAAVDGITVEELCAISEVIAPFLRAPQESTTAIRALEASGD